MSFLSTCRYLNSFTNYEQRLDKVSPANFTLTRFKKLLKVLGHPEACFKIIHVAGTKGKGSTCAFTAEILAQHGLRVGLYMSPHLSDVRERIEILAGKRAEIISKQDFCALIRGIKPALEHFRADFGAPTYFEVLTAAALVFFRHRKVDCAVLETGLGGRLDATNATAATVSGITPIAREHQNILGSTLARIAGEKAGIIKRGQTVFVAPQTTAARRIILARCRHVGARTVWLGRDITWQREQQTECGQAISVRTTEGRYRVKTRMLGAHQAMNAAMALGMAEALTASRLSPVIQLSKALPGRFEIVRRYPHIILDVAHTPGSVAAVGQTAKEIFPDKKFLAILGLAKDKDAFGIIKNLLKFSSRIILTRADHPRAEDLDLAQFRAKFPTGRFSKYPGVAAALSAAKEKAKKDDVILVIGSFYVVAEAQELLNEPRRNHRREDRDI